MPSKSKESAALLPISKKLIEPFVVGPMSAEAVSCAPRVLKKALMERVLSAEVSHVLGYAPGSPNPDDVGNHRNGTSGKTALAGDVRAAVAGGWCN